METTGSTQLYLKVVLDFKVFPSFQIRYTIKPVSQECMNPSFLSDKPSDAVTRFTAERTDQLVRRAGYIVRNEVQFPAIHMSYFLSW